MGNKSKKPIRVKNTDCVYSTIYLKRNTETLLAVEWTKNTHWRSK